MNTIWYVKGTSANAAVNVKGDSQVRGLRDGEWREGDEGGKRQGLLSEKKAQAAKKVVGQ